MRHKKGDGEQKKLAITIKQANSFSALFLFACQFCLHRTRFESRN